MEAECDPKYGVTGPTSWKESEPWMIEKSDELVALLQSSGFFESEESAQMRERVLGRLDFMVKRFVRELPGAPERPGGKIFTFGSYRLGVHDRGADIDTLCVAPRHVTRQDFFTVFYEQLAQDQAVTELTKIEDSHVPLIKLKFHGIAIDLTFARIHAPVIHDTINLMDDGILRTMDEKCIVSLNGSRVTDLILSLIPNRNAFHGVLRAVKLWAKRRGIYGATYGYFGGVAFAICVARVCQMYPRACAYELLCRFFEFYSTWKWPSPILLRPIVNHSYRFKVWDPKSYPADKYHRMPVITPAYPSMCSTHTVTQSTATHITAEFSRAHEILRTGRLDDLFETAFFFKAYKLFLEVSIATSSPSDFLTWSGYVESKVRVLSSKLETIENIKSALPFPKSFKDVADASDGKNTEDGADETEENTKRFKTSSANENSAGSDNADAAKADSGANPSASGGNAIDGFTIAELSSAIYKTSWFIAINVTMAANTGKKLYIDKPISEFLEFVNKWDRKTGQMKISILPRKKRDVLAFVEKAAKGK